MDLASIRKEYRSATLVEADAPAAPLPLMQQWLAQALQAGCPEPTAFVLSTADAHGLPDGRVVLLKDLDEKGMTFYTNYESHKGQQLQQNPHATAVFFWPEVERQMRVSGKVEKVSREESEMYYKSRPKESRVGAWASAQSRVLPNRETLEQAFLTLMDTYQEREVPLPDYWGGYRIQPLWIEFWQGRPGRLHDRLRYTRLEDDSWKIERLAP